MKRREHIDTEGAITPQKLNEGYYNVWAGIKQPDISFLTQKTVILRLHYFSP